jgi:hypothetical protein
VTGEESSFDDQLIDFGQTSNGTAFSAASASSRDCPRGSGDRFGKWRLPALDAGVTIGDDAFNVNDQPTHGFEQSSLL